MYGIKALFWLRQLCNIKEVFFVFVLFDIKPLKALSPKIDITLTESYIKVYVSASH